MGPNTYLQVVEDLVTGDDPPGRLLTLRDDAAFISMNDNSVAAVIFPTLRGSALLTRITELLSAERSTHFKIVIIGGGDEMRTILGKLAPGVLSRRMVQTFHLGDNGAPWVGSRTRLDSAVGRALAAAATPRNDQLSFDALAQLALPPPTAEQQAAGLEHRAFMKSLGSRKPWATWAMAATLTVLFGLEELWGGSEFYPTLMRMGANSPVLTPDEPWRVASSAFLHAGFLHFSFNTMVLLWLGGFIERVLGSRRFVALYAVSAVAGGLASVALMDALLSVGASGAIFGLLGASAGLGWRPGRALPSVLVARIRRAAMVNLGINLIVSMLVPQIDIMAHVGGAVVGVLAVTTGLLTRGVSFEDNNSARSGTDSRGWSVAAATSVAGLALALIAAFAAGKPWQLRPAPSFETVQLEQWGLHLEVPATLGPPYRDGPDLAFGDPLLDRVHVRVTARPLSPPLTAAELQNEGDRFVETERPIPEGTSRLGPPTTSTDPYPSVELEYGAPNGFRESTRFVLFPTANVAVWIDYWDGDPRDKATAARILKSLGIDAAP